MESSRKNYRRWIQTYGLFSDQTGRTIVWGCPFWRESRRFNRRISSYSISCGTNGLRNAMGSFNDVDLEELCDIRVPTIALSCQQLETLEELSRKFCRDQSFDVGNQSLKQLCISQVQSLTRSMTKKLATVNKLLQLMKYRQNQFMNDIFWYSFLSQKKNCNIFETTKLSFYTSL